MPRLRLCHRSPWFVYADPLVFTSYKCRSRGSNVHFSPARQKCRPPTPSWTGPVLHPDPRQAPTSAVSSRRRKSATTSSHITATSTNSGLALSSRSASDVTIARSGLSRCTAFALTSALMVGRSIRGIRCIGRGEAGPAETQLGPSTGRQPREGSASAALSS